MGCSRATYPVSRHAMEMSERESLLQKIKELEGEHVSSKMVHGTVDELRRCVNWLLAGKPWIKRSSPKELATRDSQ